MPGALHIRKTPLVCALLLLLSACATLPSREGVTISRALEGSTDTRLGSSIAGLVAAHPGMSGIYALPEGKGALAARIILSEVAEQSLDVQYYIWHRDGAGIMLMDALKRAAERGVRVRLLVDDNGVVGMDALLAALNAHPNIQVRIVNPFPNRSVRWVGFLTDFGRLNRRMHNKAFTADSQATIVGGRNIGNEYFAAGQDFSFTDLDVLAVGPAVSEVADSFDHYWNCAAAYPLELLFTYPDASPDQISTAADEVRADPQAVAYIEALHNTQVVQDLLEGSLPFEWARTHLVSDNAAKLLGIDVGEERLVLGQMENILGSPRREFLLVSPYFVPTKHGTESLVAMAKRGVQVTVLTNSLAATDVSVVHAGYAKRRKALLKGGVRLFELKPTADTGEPTKNTGFGGSSSASLHAKTFAVDGERIFVGSFNFDPRSAKLNTEMGLVIDSPALAARIAYTFSDTIPAKAYEVRLSHRGSLEWVEQGPQGEIRSTSEPDAGFMRKITVGIVRWLPIEWML